MAKRKVVLTGASGTIAALLLPPLRERYNLIPVDVRDTDKDGQPIEGVQIANLIDANRDNYRHLFQGVDAVVHLGFTRADDKSDPDQDFQAESANVQMAYNVFQVALEENVRRVVMASSNHAADYYEPLILDGKMDFVTPDMKPLSDNYYGWAKEVYEHLGFVFAVGKMNGKDGERRPLENVQVRIGGPRETDVARCTLGDLRCMRRALAVYISQRDMAQLFIKSIETEDIRDEQGIPFQVFYGVSDNPHAFWSIANARKIIGYEPQDNSEIQFGDLIREHIAAATP